MTTWIISDTHFGDTGLLGSGLGKGKTARDFDTVAQMNECLADNWNDHVAADDTIFHLGDVFAGEGWKLLARLKGQKHLILGNHDNPRNHELAQVFQSMAIWKAMDEAKVVLTHVPIILSEESGLGARFAVNVHGHLHSKPCTDRTPYLCER